jgi:hypothetical protein
VTGAGHPVPGHADRGQAAPGSRAGLTRLAVAILLVVGFMFGAGPLLARLPGIRPLTTFISERDIPAGEYFYTDVDAFADADAHMRAGREIQPPE